MSVANNSTLPPDAAEVVDPGLYVVLDAPLTAGFLVLASTLVLLMQSGFAQLETGVTRITSAQHVFMKNFMDSAISALCFYVFGFAFAFGNNACANAFIGCGGFALSGVKQMYPWIIQYSNANNASTIFGGSLVGRTRFVAHAIVTALISTLLFPIAAHWVWTRTGWLANLGERGAIDAVGAGPVHLLSGCVGLIGAYFVGPRIGFSAARYRSKFREAHNKLLAASGIYLLWVGWFAFTAASSGRVSRDAQVDTVGRIATCTLLSCSSAVVVSYFVRRAMYVDQDVIWLGNACLAGLVSITSGCATMQPWVGIVGGAVAAVLLAGFSEMLLRLNIDDPLDASAVHMSGAVWGLLATGLFADPTLVRALEGSAAADDDTSIHEYGLFYGGHIMQLGLQLLEVVSIVAWCAAVCVPVFWLMRRQGYLRVSKEAEVGGLDMFHFDSSAYVSKQPDVYGSGSGGGGGEAGRAALGNAALNEGVQAVRFAETADGQLVLLEGGDANMWKPSATLATMRQRPVSATFSAQAADAAPPPRSRRLGSGWFAGRKVSSLRGLRLPYAGSRAAAGAHQARDRGMTSPSASSLVDAPPTHESSPTVPDASSAAAPAWQSAAVAAVPRTALQHAPSAEALQSDDTTPTPAADLLPLPLVSSADLLRPPSQRRPGGGGGGGGLPDRLHDSPAFATAPAPQVHVDAQYFLGNSAYAREHMGRWMPPLAEHYGAHATPRHEHAASGAPDGEQRSLSASVVSEETGMSRSESDSQWHDGVSGMGPFIPARMAVAWQRVADADELLHEGAPPPPLACAPPRLNGAWPWPQAPSLMRSQPAMRADALYYAPPHVHDAHASTAQEYADGHPQLVQQQVRWNASPVLASPLHTPPASLAYMPNTVPAHVRSPPVGAPPPLSVGDAPGAHPVGDAPGGGVETGASCAAAQPSVSDVRIPVAASCSDAAATACTPVNAELHALTSVAESSTAADQCDATGGAPLLWHPGSGSPASDDSATVSSASYAPARVA